MSDDKCQVPPEGWCCTRQPGHEGPCAALPDAAASQITMTAIRSNYIAEVGYDEAAGELHVRFLTSFIDDDCRPLYTFIYPLAAAIGWPQAKVVYDRLVGGDVPYNFSVGKFFDQQVEKTVDPKLVRKVMLKVTR